VTPEMERKERYFHEKVKTRLKKIYNRSQGRNK